MATRAPSDLASNESDTQRGKDSSVVILIASFFMMMGAAASLTFI